MKHTMRTIASALAVAGLLLGGTAAASAEGFTVTATPNTGVKQGDVITVSIAGLTGTLGVYASLCKEPVGTATPVCDPDRAHMAWITANGATGSTKDSGTIAAQAKFTASGTDVNCLVDACIIYVRADHMNPGNTALTKTVPVKFVEGVAAPTRKADVPTALLNGVEVRPTVTGNLEYRTPVELVVRVVSGQTVTLEPLTPDCAVDGTKVTALKGTGTCAIRATTPGNDTYAPLSAGIVFPFYLKPGYQSLTSSVVLKSVARGKAGNIKASQLVSNMGEIVSLASKTPAACTVKAKSWGWTILGRKAGTCRLVASAPADDTKYTAASLNLSLVISKK